MEFRFLMKWVESYSGKLFINFNCLLVSINYYTMMGILRRSSSVGEFDETNCLNSILFAIAFGIDERLILLRSSEIALSLCECCFCVGEDGVGGNTIA